MFEKQPKAARPVAVFDELVSRDREVVALVLRSRIARWRFSWSSNVRSN